MATRSQTTRGPGLVAHLGVAFVGLALLVYSTLPLEYDGVLHGDRSAWLFLAVTGTASATVGGLLEGLLVRSAHWLAYAILLLFAALTFYPVRLMSGRWWPSDIPSDSSSLGVGVVAWFTTLALEYLIARAVRRSVHRGDAALPG